MLVMVFLVWECRMIFLPGFFFPLCWVIHFIAFLYVRMSVVHSSYQHLLAVVAYKCGLPFYSCVSKVAHDGDVLGGVELEVHVAKHTSGVAFSGHVPLLVCLALMTRLLSKPFLSFKRWVPALE